MSCNRHAASAMTTRDYEAASHANLQIKVEVDDTNDLHARVVILWASG